MKLTAIYVPGLGDNLGYVQSNLVRLWRFRGLQGTTHIMPWAGLEVYSTKAQRLEKLIDSLAVNDRRIVLIGASAGGTAVINAYCARRNKVAVVMLICPKVNNSTNIGAKLIEKNPAFLTSLQQEEIAQAHLTASDKQKFVIFISPRDGLVQKTESLIPGVIVHELAPVRHTLAILYALSFGFAKLRAEVKRITAKAKAS